MAARFFLVCPQNIYSLVTTQVQHELLSQYEMHKMEDIFMEIYNSMTFQSCDGLFRSMVDVTMVQPSSDDRQRHLQDGVPDLPLPLDLPQSIDMYAINVTNFTWPTYNATFPTENKTIWIPAVFVVKVSSLELLLLVLMC